MTTYSIIRKLHNRTLQHDARALKVSSAFLSQIGSSQREAPNDVKVGLEKIYGISIDDLLREIGPSDLRLAAVA